MRYLFFDIECCDGVNICELGYVIADEKLCVIEKKVITINPEKPFRLTDRKGRKDLNLCFPAEVYFNSPVFSYYYSEIKELLEYPDQLIVGFAIGNDALFLKVACDRYGLTPIDFNFVDVQKAYKIRTNGKSVISLEKVLEQLEIPQLENQHRSDEDSLGTLLILKKLLPPDGDSSETVDKLYPKACGSSKRINGMYTGNSLSGMLAALDKDANSLSRRKKKNLFNDFVERVQNTGKIIHSKLNNKVLCLNKSFEKKHLREMLVLIQLLANHGCKYTSNVGLSDFYVASKAELESTEKDVKSRYFAATGKKGRRHIEVLTMDGLCKILGIKEEDLSKMDMPKAPRSKKNKRSKKQQKISYSSGNISITVGDLLNGQNKTAAG